MPIDGTREMLASPAIHTPRCRAGAKRPRSRRVVSAPGTSLLENSELPRRAGAIDIDLSSIWDAEEWGGPQDDLYHRVSGGQ
jgi:hypothetical protein